MIDQLKKLVEAHKAFKNAVDKVQAETGLLVCQPWNIQIVSPPKEVLEILSDIDLEYDEFQNLHKANINGVDIIALQNKDQSQ